MRAPLAFWCTFVSNLVHGLGAFVFAPVQTQLIPEPAADSRIKLQEMAKELQKVLPLPLFAEPSKQLEPAVDQPKKDKEEQESRRELLAASSLFNSASSENTEEQQAAEDALRKAMASPSRNGPADRSLQANMPSMCLPDFTKCPQGWSKEGVLCFAADSYSGPCAAEADLTDMSAEQKQAFAKACSLEFPCQEDCAQDFNQTCPSLWREIGRGICSAPLQYQGVCSARLIVSSMTQQEKYLWSVHCGARWPCSAPKKHNYVDICPKGWSLGVGQVCVAPQTYDGPCEHTAYMNGATASDKKAFEAMCHAEWAEAGGECAHDFDAACPFGWYDDGAECVAPSLYDICSNRKSFRLMTPAAKEDWAQNCAVKFPCQNRVSCDKAYSAPCPADWHAFNEGTSCAAPSGYAGPCMPVLTGLLDMSISEKVDVESKCALHWPCLGEVYASILQATQLSSGPRKSEDPAHYVFSNGPIDDVSGMIKRRRVF